MAVELTHICDRCGDRHTGDTPPFSWSKNVQLLFDAPLWPSYSPFHIDEKASLLCSQCAEDVSAAVKAVWVKDAPQT